MGTERYRPALELSVTCCSMFAAASAAPANFVLTGLDCAKTEPSGLAPQDICLVCASSQHLEHMSVLQLGMPTAKCMAQGSRMRNTKTEYVSCPSCGRTLFDLQEVTEQIRTQTGHLPGGLHTP